MDKYESRLKRYIGPGVETIDKTSKEFIRWLKEIWYKGDYFNEKMNYGVWFDLDEEEES
jgi:hypothetical protein